MNNELIERIDFCLTHIALGLTVTHILEECKATLSQQQEVEPVVEVGEGQILQWAPPYKRYPEGTKFYLHPPKPAAQPARCEYCDGSGDVHSFDGEWLGSCTECLPAAQQQEAEPVAWTLRWPDDIIMGTVNYPTTYETKERAREYADGCTNGESIVVAPLYLHPPKPAAPDVRCEGCGYMTHHREHMGCVRAAQPQVPDNGMAVGTRYEYTEIGSAEQKWWGCVLVGFDGGHPLIRTDAGHYHLRPLSEYRFRTATEEGK